MLSMISKEWIKLCKYQCTYIILFIPYSNPIQWCLALTIQYSAQFRRRQLCVAQPGMFIILIKIISGFDTIPHIHIEANATPKYMPIQDTSHKSVALEAPPAIRAKKADEYKITNGPAIRTGPTVSGTKIPIKNPYRSGKKNKNQTKPGSGGNLYTCPVFLRAEPFCPTGPLF